MPYMFHTCAIHVPLNKGVFVFYGWYLIQNPRHYAEGLIGSPAWPNIQPRDRWIGSFG